MLVRAVPEAAQPKRLHRPQSNHEAPLGIAARYPPNLPKVQHVPAGEVLFRRQQEESSQELLHPQEPREASVETRPKEAFNAEEARGKEESRSPEVQEEQEVGRGGR